MPDFYRWMPVFGAANFNCHFESFLLLEGEKVAFLSPCADAIGQKKRWKIIRLSTDHTRLQREEPESLRPNVLQAYGHSRRSEEHTSELQSLMRISYAVFCVKKKKIIKTNETIEQDINQQDIYNQTE